MDVTDNYKKYKKKALLHAVTIFVLLFGGVILLSIYYEFSQIDLEGLLFLVSFLCCVFIAKNVYDVTINTDIMEAAKKESAQDMFFAAKDLYIQLFNNSPVPYLIIDEEGVVKTTNVAAVRMFGIPQTKIKGLRVFEYISSEEREHIDYLLEKFRNNISISDEMVRVKRTDHKEVWALLSLFSSRAKTGEKLGLLTLVDITKQKKAEDAKSEFVSLASHQLRTPIAGIKWSAELLQLDNPEKLTDRQKKYIDRLLVSVRRMARLIDDFLRVSRFELGTFKAEETEVDLINLFKDVMEEQAEKAERKKITVKTFYDKSVKKIISDPNLLRMIITNLYSNALKYTPEGGTVHIGYSRKKDALVITVSDNGMGIPVEDQAEIFSKLFRASNAVRNVPDGTGLGLYIVREAVSVLKGQVSFTSTENIGTTFEVMVPLKLPKDES